MSKSFKHLLS